MFNVRANLSTPTGEIDLALLAELVPVLSEWDRGTAGETHYHPRVTYYADYLGHVAALWRFPIRDGKLPRLLYSNTMPGELREKFSPNRKASGWGPPESHHWTKYTKSTFRLNNGGPQAKKRYEEANDLGVMLRCEADRWIDQFIEDKVQEVECDD